jgi:serine/threonine protein kinase
MGVVWSSYDTELARRVALKMLHGDISSRAGVRDGLDDELQNRLLREAQAMARLSHPNVVAVYDLLIHDRQLVLALELIDGVSLTTWLSSEKHPWRKVLGAFIDAGRGLAAAHAVGLVHRDFKPDNVLRDRAGRVAVTDFGLARLGGSPGAHAAGPSPDGTMPMHAVAHGMSMTRTGALIGTPRYMAPEQIDGRTVDARSDQFSFCVALYEALYGEHPLRAPRARTSGATRSRDSSRR